MLEPLAHLLMHLREADRLELEECGHTPFDAYDALRAPSELACLFASMKSGKPAAIVAFKLMTPKTLGVALLATDEWSHVARQVYRWGVKQARPDLLRRGFTRAEVRTMEGHDDAIRLLEHFGFGLEARLPRYGASGKAFLQYAWRLDDHALDAAALA